MSSGHHGDRPRHLASARHFQGAARRPAPAIDFDDIPIDFDEIDDNGFPIVAEPDDAEVAPVARVKQSRLAFAVAVTLAALPLLVLDNFAANAEGGDPARVEAAEVRDVGARAELVTPTAPLRVARSEVPATTSTLAPTTTVAPTTTTVEPTPTTEAPTTTTTRAPSPPPAPTTTTTAAPAPVERRVVPADPSSPATWDRLAECEAGGNWAANTGNGYYGGLQFSLATWQDMGGTGYPHEASKATQIAMGQRLHERSGWDAWPSCARKLGWS